MRWLQLAVAFLALVAPLAAQAPVAAPDAAPLGNYAYTLQNQPASEAIQLVRPLLSQRGTVELQAGSNTLVIRDSLSALSRIVPVLRGFDHPALPLRLEVLIIEAGRGRLAGEPARPLPEPLQSRLREVVRYDRFEVLARADVEAREGEEVTYEIGQGYLVNFRLGTLLADQRIRLNGFRVLRSVESATAVVSPSFEARSILHGNFNIWLDQTLVLTLARTESSPKALMVAVTCSKPTQERSLRRR